MAVNPTRHSTCEVTETFQWDLVHLLQLGRLWVYDPKKYPIPPLFSQLLKDNSLLDYKKLE